MFKVASSALLFIICTVLSSTTLNAEESEPVSDPEESRWAFLKRSWYKDQGIELPRQFGLNFNYIYMNRDIEVTDVTIKLPNRPPESISDRADFAVRNKTSLTVARFDAWVLPFLNVYGMIGETRTNTSLATFFEITPPIGDPIPIEVVEDSKVNGPLLGGGITMVIGHGDWFGMLDANYAQSDLDVFKGKLDAWFVSARVGTFRNTAKGQFRYWAGIAYLSSAQQLSIVQEQPVLGEIEVVVDQQPLNPATLQIGGSYSFGRRWDVLFEAGTNFDDATVAVVSASYRFGRD